MRYKLGQVFRVTCLFTGECNTKGYDTITDVKSPPRIFIYAAMCEYLYVNVFYLICRESMELSYIYILLCEFQIVR